MTKRRPGEVNLRSRPQWLSHSWGSFRISRATLPPCSAGGELCASCQAQLCPPLLPPPTHIDHTHTHFHEATQPLQQGPDRSQGSFLPAGCEEPCASFLGHPEPGSHLAELGPNSPFPSYHVSLLGDLGQSWPCSGPQFPLLGSGGVAAPTPWAVWGL